MSSQRSSPKTLCTKTDRCTQCAETLLHVVKHWGVTAERTRSRAVPPPPPRSSPGHGGGRYRLYIALAFLASSASLILSRFHMPVPRLRSVTLPHMAAKSMMSFVGLNCCSTPYSEAA